MTYHFVNLISWRFFIYPIQNSKIQIDSISLQFIALCFGRPIRRNSGLSVNINYSESIFLVSNSRSELEPSIVLPTFDNINEVTIGLELIKSIEKFKSIYIGITSPKQDKLARLIQDVYPEKSIYCLGAALYSDYNFGNVGLNWLYLLIKQPKRTIKKLILTSNEILRLVLYKKDRKLFRSFIDNLN